MKSCIFCSSKKVMISLHPNKIGESPRIKNVTKTMMSIFGLLWINEARVEDKTFIWESVWWKTKNWSWGIYTSHIHWVDQGTGTLKDRDEVNRRDVCECDGWVCVLEVIGAPSISENTAGRKWNWSRSCCTSWTPEAAKKTVSFPMIL
jgi:hypothetical protein